MIVVYRGLCYNNARCSTLDGVLTRESFGPTMAEFAPVRAVGLLLLYSNSVTAKSQVKPCLCQRYVSCLSIQFGANHDILGGRCRCRFKTAFGTDSPEPPYQVCVISLFVVPTVKTARFPSHGNCIICYPSRALVGQLSSHYNVFL